jgi:hypothetical protein
MRVVEHLAQPFRTELECPLPLVLGGGRGGGLLDRAAELLLEHGPLGQKRLPVGVVVVLRLGEQAALLLGFRPGLGGDGLELFDFGERAVALGGERDLRLTDRSARRSTSCASSSSAVRLSRFLGDTPPRRRSCPAPRRAAPRRSTSARSWSPLLGGGAEDCESLEHGAELLLEAVRSGLRARRARRRAAPAPRRDGAPARRRRSAPRRGPPRGARAPWWRAPAPRSRVADLRGSRTSRRGARSRPSATLLAQASILGDGRLRLDQGGPDPLDIDAELVTFVGRLPERGELLE